MREDISHVCLFPEFDPERSTNGVLVVSVYDHEPEIADRRRVGVLAKGSENPGWQLFLKLTGEQCRRSWGSLPETLQIGTYSYIGDALRDLAHLLGQYWSPNR